MIPCYWENTPSGCLKPHCAFQHTKPRPMLKSAVERVEEIKQVENQGEYGVASYGRFVIQNVKHLCIIYSTLFNYSNRTYSC